MNEQGELFEMPAAAPTPEQHARALAEFVRPGVVVQDQGSRFVVTFDGQIADFWPGTGRFAIRGGRAGAGIRYLLHLLKVPDAPIT